jgi:PKD repeat protein
VLGATASSLRTPSVTRAQAAITSNAPVWPIIDPIATPPPIPSMPPAGVEPPGEVIADPVTPGATCDTWHLQTNYGDRWPSPGASTWWEYRCGLETQTYVDHPCPNYPMCEAVCYGAPFDCYWFTEERTDYFSWNETSSEAEFYGQVYTSTVDDGYFYQSNSYWWDGATAQWYSIDQRHLLTVSKVGAGSGAVTSSPAGISCGDTCQASLEAGTAVTLTATPDPSFAFVGWSGDCWGTGVCQVTMDRPRSVTAEFAPVAPPPPPNVAPMAAFAVNCDGLSCGLDAGASTDLDGSIVEYRWDLGDDTTGTGLTAAHTYAQPVSYTVTLTVTDDDGAVATATEPVAVTAPNAAPTAAFVISCTGLACSFNGHGSSDDDGTITSYDWDFGDGPTVNGASVDHSYGQPGSYTVMLTVTDDDGAAATTTRVVAPITLTAHGYKWNGRQQVDLTWTGSSAAGFDIYRNGVRLVTVHGTAYTDNLNRRGSGTYAYTVRGVATSIRSKQVTVTF